MAFAIDSTAVTPNPNIIRHVGMGNMQKPFRTDVAIEEGARVTFKNVGGAAADGIIVVPHEGANDNWIGYSLHKITADALSKAPANQPKLTVSLRYYIEVTAWYASGTALNIGTKLAPANTPGSPNAGAFAGGYVKEASGSDVPIGISLTKVAGDVNGVVITMGLF